MKSLRTLTKLSLSNTTRVNPVAEFGLFELCSEGEDKPGTQGKEALEHGFVLRAPMLFKGLVKMRKHEPLEKHC